MMIDKMSSFVKNHNRPRNKFGVTVSSLVLAFALLFAACDDAGLGESIDTTAPTVSIKSPESSAVISGAFKVEGTCFDDKAVASVVVTVTNTVTGEKVGTHTAAITGNNWSLDLNQPAEGKYPLSDGTYSASAICYDMAGRQSGAASRVFEIDNTAPVFCITSPNSLNINDPAAFGRSVKIKGEIADDHAIKQMDIRVFKYAGGSVTEITSGMAKTSFSGFETAGGTEIKIAQYFPDGQTPAANSDDYPLYQNYMAMYSGATVGDTVSFYIFPFLTDIAGNTSGNCYIQTQLKKVVSEACGVETTSDSLQTAQFKKMINGSYSLGEVDVEKVKQILSGQYEQSSYNYWSHMGKEDAGVDASNALLAMSVNANNSPMYEFGGFAIDTKKVSFTEASPGGQISVRISAGLDGTLVKPGSLKVYLWECDDTLALTGNQDITKPETASYSSARGDFAVTDGTQDISTVTASVATGTYTVTLPAGILGGSRYRMTAKGEDEDGNELFSDSIYAFMATISANAPSVDFDDQFFIKASAISEPPQSQAGTPAADCYKAKITIADATQQAMTKDGSYVLVTPVLYTGYYAAKGELVDVTPAWKGSDKKIKHSEITDEGNGNYQAFLDMNIFPLATISADNYTVALKISARNDEATSEVATFIFWADNKKPALDITSPASGASIFESDKNIEKDSSGAVTGNYTPRGTWSDLDGSGTYRLWWSTTDTTAPTFAYKPVRTPGDTTDHYGDGATIYYEKLGPDAYVKRGILGASDIVNDYYTIELTGTWTEAGSFTPTAAQTQWSATIPVAESVGQIISVIAMDAAGNVSDIKTVSGLAYDFGLPAAALVSEPGGTAVVKEYYSKASGSFDFKISAQDGFKMDSLTITAQIQKTGLAPVTIVLGDGGNAAAYGYSEEVVGSETTDTKIVKTVKIAADPNDGKGDGVWTITACAKDAAGRTTTQELIKTTIDCVKPAFVYYNVYTDIAIGKNEGRRSDWYKDQTLAITGRVNEMTSGLSAVYYWLKFPGRTDAVPDDLTAEGAADGSVAIAGTKSDRTLYKIMPDKFAQSAGANNFLYVQAVDLAGNKSDKTHYEIQVDQTPPTVSTAYYTYDNGETMTKADGSVLTNGTKPLTLYGAASDALSGLKSLSFKIGDTEIPEGASGATILYSTAACSTAGEYKALDSATDDTKWTALSGLPAAAIKSWKAVIVFAQSAGATVSGDLNAAAEDLAGNSSEQKAFSLVYDNVDPTIELTSPAPASADKPSYINGSVTFKGTASDKNGLASVTVYYYNTAESKWEKLVEITDESMFNWSATAPVTSQSGDSFAMLGYTTPYAGQTKPLSIKVAALDKASNLAEKVYQYTIDPDGDRPKITITNVDLKPENKPMTSANPALRTGTSDIYGSVYDDDGLKTLEYKKSGDTDWTILDLTGTSFTITGLADGPHTLLFRVTDNDNAVFTSSASASYVSPKLYGKKDGADSGAYESGDTQLYVKIDTEAPTTGNTAYYSYSKAAGAYGARLASLGTLGGDASMFKYKVNAKDTNGIKSVTVSIKDTDISVSTTEKTTPLDDQAGFDGFEVAGIDVSGLAEGTYTAEIVVEDKAGLKKKDTVKIAVDNTPPKVTIDSPAEDKKVMGILTEVYGGADDYGTITEGSTTLSTIYYAVSMIGKSSPDATLPLSFSSYEYYDEDGNLQSKPLAEEVSVGQKDYGYKLFKDASATWKVSFDGDLSSTTGTHERTLNDYLASYGIASASDIKNSVFASVVRMYVWIKVVDAVGNETEVCRALKVDPQGDRPEIRFGYPEESGRTVGGTVNLNGDVTDPRADHTKPEETDTIWVQIISNKVTGHGTYDYTEGSTIDPKNFVVKAADVRSWVSYAKSDGTGLYNVYDMNAYVSGTKTKLDDTTAANVTDATAKNYGILASFGGTNWSLEINSESEFNINDTTNQVAVRAYAYNGKWSVPVARALKFDMDSPNMTDRYLKMADGSTRAYKDNIFLRDKNQAGAAAYWNITFKLTDGDTIKNIGFSNIDAQDAEKKKALVKDDTTHCVDLDPSKPYSAVQVSYPLNTLGGADGKETLYVYYEDAKENPGSGHYTFTVNHDNTPPTLTTSGADFNISADVCNKDGWYKLGSKATEGSSESGFERVVIYFKRASANKVFDPMYYKGSAANYTIIPDSITSASAIQYYDGIYWKKIGATAALADGATTLTLSAADPNVHTGGLVKINGVNYRIKLASETETTVKLESDIGVSGAVDAYFALGNVVDNTTAEKEPDPADIEKAHGYGYGYGTSHANDDGDLMVEKAETVGTQTIWEALINSKNIPDGPIDICYTVYDAAGNYSLGSVTYAANGAFVANNAPRIANVTVKTDYNGNDRFDEGESYTWFTMDEKPESWEQALSAITLHGGDKAAAATDPDYTTAYITAKGKTAIAPEILGGNGALYYHYSYPSKEGYNKTAFMASDAGREDQTQSQSADITMQLGDLMDAQKGLGKYEFIIYDSTEGMVGVPDLTATVTTPTTQKASVTVWMDNQVNDTTDPTGKIQRFYWKDINDNSIYGSDSASDARDLLGHIELEDELPAAFTDGATDKEMDKDPKVSGKIVIRGEAFDAIRLDSLYITLPGFVGLTGLPTTGNITKESKTFYKMAAYNAAEGKWSDSDDDETPKTIKDNGWRFDVVSSKFDAAGHHVTWSLELDTNKYGASAHAATDVLLEFMSKDKGVPTCSKTGTAKYTSVDGTTTYAATTYAAGQTSSYSGDGGYRMDIVPYITKVYTNLAVKSKNNWSVYNRTAKGAYPVYKYKNSNESTNGSSVAMTTKPGEIVQVYGFNLNGLKQGTTALESVASANRKDKNTSYDCYEFKAGDLENSQEVEFNVGGIYTLNNKNAVDAKGGYSKTTSKPEGDYSVYANYYNRLPNDSNNNNLTDDIKFEVWQLNDSAAVPISNEIVDPVMKINPSNGMIGFAFENDPTYFSMATQTRSYDYWAASYDKVTIPAFDYISSATADYNGRTVGVGFGNDISGSTNDFFVLFYSKWGSSHDTAATCEVKNNVRLEGNATVSGNWNKTRIQSPSIATAERRVYLAYYDDLNKQIRFRSSEKNDIGDAKGNFGNFNGSNWTNQYTFADNNNTAQIVKSGGQYPFLCIAVAPGKGSSDDLVGMVWYDGSDCWYSSNNTPGTSRAGNATGTGWSTPTKVFSGAGQYCKIAFDKTTTNVGVHIAAYDVSNTCVRYAYASNAAAESPSFITCVVDDSGSCGKYLTLDVALEGTASVPVPQIGYYSTSGAKPMLAKYVGETALTSISDGDDMAGFLNGGFTGRWEVSAVPTTSTVCKDRVNVALRKTSAGVITEPATGTSWYYNNDKGYDSESYGYVYGLANTNAVMGYCRLAGSNIYIETAQRVADKTN